MIIMAITFITAQGLLVQRRGVEGWQDGADQAAHRQEETVWSPRQMAQGECVASAVAAIVIKLGLGGYPVSPDAGY